MKTFPAESETPRDVDSNLLEHARLGLKRIHTVSRPRDEEPTKTKQEDKEEESSKKKTKVNKQKPVSPKPTKQPEKKTQYISTKKPVEKSVFYQHSKQGVKYWFEEQKPKTYTSKIPIGRKGTLLGLVDAPFK